MSNDNDTVPRDGADDSVRPEAPEPARKTIEAWESEKGTPAWLRAATRALHRFPRGRELLEQEFDDAVRAASNLALR